MGKSLRYIAVAVILIAGYFAMTYMQERFDRADLRKAVAAVQSVHPTSDPSLNLIDAVTIKYRVPPQSIHWDAEIESKWRGTVRVIAEVPGTYDPLIWLVDVSAQRVMPESEAAKQLLY